MNLEELILYEINDNTVAELLEAFGTILLGFVLAKVIFYISRKFIKPSVDATTTRWDSLLVYNGEGPVVLAVVIIGTYVGLTELVMPKFAHVALEHMLFFGLIMDLAWLLSRGVEGVLQEYIRPLASQKETQIDGQLLTLLSGVIRVSIWLVALVLAFDNAGWDILSILAGLGIGGLAFALAAKDTVANLFGGLNLFLDKPFKVGDMVVLLGHRGFVEEIGLRSTRLRTHPAKALVVIPNETVSNSAIVNLSNAPSMMAQVYFRVPNSLSSDELERACNALRTCFDDQEGLEPKRLATLHEHDEYGTQIRVRYYVSQGQKLSAIKAAVLMKLRRCLESEGIPLVEAELFRSVNSEAR